MRTTLPLLLLAAAVSAAPIRLARHPDYHDGKIVFSWQGDLWVVAEDGSNPRRLTVHLARDRHPRFSPDGRFIAFSSDRYGNDDVFVIPASGGEARRLTFHSAGDTVAGWSRDSRRVLFSSARGRVYPGIPSLYEVPVEGGLEEPLPSDWGAWGSWSPDGRKLAFNRHPIPWSRKHYRGSYAADLWVLDREGNRFTRLLDGDVPEQERANALWPLYGDGEIWFVSDRDVRARPGSPEVLRSANNLWKIPDTGGTPIQVTRHTSGSLFFPSISANGRVIVYEEGFGLWRLDTRSGRTEEVRVELATDEKENSLEIVTVKDEAEGFHLAPSTKRAVISAKGELFTIATDKGNATRVTTSQTRERLPAWSPDGKRIAFVSDQTGRDEVWVTDPDGKNARQLSDTDTEKLSLAWSPDAKSLAWTASDHKLHVIALESGPARVVASSDVGNLSDPEFSPDGNWLSFTKPDRDLRPHVHLVPAAGGEERRLPDERLFATSDARWTSDGKRLVLLAASGSVRDNVSALYTLSLAREEKDPVSKDVDQEAAAAAEDGDEGAARDDKKKKKGPPEVRVDWDGMDRRFRSVTRLSDDVTTVTPAPDGKSFAFVAVGDQDGRSVASLYLVQENGEQQRRLFQTTPPDPDADTPARGGGGIRLLQFSKDGKTLYFAEGDGIWSVGVGGGGGGEGASAGAPRGGGDSAARKRVSFSVRLEIDHRAARGQVFGEAWRVMRHRFYDAEMHGVDWPAMRARYEPLLGDAGSREELQDVVSAMIGELNASHTGISGGGEPDPGAVQTRFPGFELAPDPSGFYKVTHVYRHGPADKDFVKVRAGDFVLAVDGAPLRAGENYWRLYGAPPGRKMEFTVNEKAAPEGAWSARIEPVGSGAYATLQYERWVEDRKQIVERLSKGEIGYLHIRQMNQPALRKFERDLLDHRFKRALVIDQRFNPGGNIDQELLQLLQQRQYQFTKGRGSIPVTRPQRAYFGPMVVLQNERSTSDAEVFPDGFRTLKLGKTVGVTTYGAVIGTGSYRLMDGSQLRTPGSGLWNVGGTNLENFGVPPDVLVDNLPEDFAKGRDAQLEKAVEVLQEELGRLGPDTVPGRR
jgi:tricorn protease